MTIKLLGQDGFMQDKKEEHTTPDEPDERAKVEEISERIDTRFLSEPPSGLTVAKREKKTLPKEKTEE